MGTITNRFGIEKPVVTDPFSTQKIADNWQAIDDQGAMFLQNTLANRPAAGTAGRFFTATDTGQVFYDNGTEWLRLSSAAAGGSHLFEKGTQAKPGLAFAGDDNTGVGSLAADVLNFITAGRWHWRINSGGELGGRNFSSETVGALATQKAGQAHPYWTTRVDGQMQWGSGSAAPDVTLYRDAASRLRLSGDLNLTGDAIIGGVIKDGPSGDTVLNFDGDGVVVGQQALQVRMPYGDAATPGMSFNGDGNTGFYRRSNAVISWSGNGSEGGFLYSGGMRTALGTAAKPSWSFVDDSDTGFYRNGTNQMAMTLGGAVFAYFDISGHERRFHLGSESNDWIGYDPIDEIMSFYMNGGRRVTVRNAGLRVEIDGNEAAPSISFNDPDTGFFHKANLDQVGIAIDGVAEMILGRTGILIPNVYSNTTTSGTNVHVSSDGSIQRVSSLAADKDNIASIRSGEQKFGQQGSIIDRGRALDPVSFTSRLDGDDPDEVMVGLIAEQVAEHVPELAVFDPEGKLTSVSYDRVGVLALAYALEALERLDAALEA